MRNVGAQAAPREKFGRVGVAAADDLVRYRQHQSAFIELPPMMRKREHGASHAANVAGAAWPRAGLGPRAEDATSVARVLGKWLAMDRTSTCCRVRAEDVGATSVLAKGLCYWSRPGRRRTNPHPILGLLSAMGRLEKARSPSSTSFTLSGRLSLHRTAPRGCYPEGSEAATRTLTT